MMGDLVVLLADLVAVMREPARARSGEVVWNPLCGLGRDAGSALSSKVAAGKVGPLATRLALGFESSPASVALGGRRTDLGRVLALWPMAGICPSLLI